jgi:hypothetical protein
MVFLDKLLILERIIYFDFLQGKNKMRQSKSLHPRISIKFAFDYFV